MSHAHTPSQSIPMPSSDKRVILAILFGLSALVLFGVLTLPGDLLLLPDAAWLGSISQTLAPLAYGPEVLFSPLGAIAAIGAILLGSGRAHQRKRAAATGLVLGWVALALYLISAGMYILSIVGVLKPFV